MLAVLLMVAVAVVSAVTAQLRCVDAAGQAARAAARGADGTAAAARIAPSGASVSISHSGGMVRVTVAATLRPLGGWLPPIKVGASSAADLEPGEPGAAE